MAAHQTSSLKTVRDLLFLVLNAAIGSNSEPLSKHGGKPEFLHCGTASAHHCKPVPSRSGPAGLNEKASSTYSIWLLLLKLRRHMKVVLTV